MPRFRDFTEALQRMAIRRPIGPEATKPCRLSRAALPRPRHAYGAAINHGGGMPIHGMMAGKCGRSSVDRATVF